MTQNISTPTSKPDAASDEKPIPWRVLIYMAADNNLTEECIYALTEIQRVETIEGIETIALFDSGAKGVKTKIYDFGKSRKPPGPEIEEVKPLKKIGTPFSVLVPVKQVVQTSETTSRKSESASDPAVLEGFLKEHIEEHRDKRFLVVLSGHGSGAVGDFLKGNDPPSSLSIRDLADALKTVKGKIKSGKIHVLGMDSCLMSMAEVCAQLSDSVQVMVGAEGFELNTGWPYQRILEALKSEKLETMKPEKLARIIVEKYIRYYQDYEDAGVSVDQAAVDLSKFDNVTKAVGKLAAALKPKVLRNQKIRNTILLAHWRAQSYKNEQYVDLWDFCDLLEESCGDPKVEKACAAVKAAVKSVVIMSRYHGAAFQHSHGLSIFFPWRGVEKRVRRVERKSPDEKDELREYKNLKFHTETKSHTETDSDPGIGWGDFLEAYVEATRRKMRGEQELGYKETKPVCIVPTDESGLLVREGPPVDKGEGRGTGSMKNPPVCFIPRAWGKEND